MAGMVRGLLAVGCAIGMLTSAGAVASAKPTVGEECRMSEQKPGYECRFGEWKRDYTPAREGKACAFGDRAPGLRCTTGRWESTLGGTPSAGETCGAVGAKQVGIGGLLTCTHGPYGFTWQ